jgi:DNA-binding Lrp family transcriptional regulator
LAEKTDYTPQNVGRRLRELENEGVIEVKYMRGHAHYRFKGAPSIEQKIARALEWFDELSAAVSAR